MALNRPHSSRLEDRLSIPHHSKSCTLGVHDESYSKEEVLLNGSLFQNWKLKNGTALRLQANVSTSRRESALSLDERHHRRGSNKAPNVTLFFHYQDIPSEILVKHPNLQISVSQNIASSLSLTNHSLVIVSLVNQDEGQASHVEIGFRDTYLTRADMWRLVCTELAGKSVYKGQRITFLGSIKAQVKAIYRQGSKLTSGFFAPSTKPIFRSESARYVIFLQMSKEMWDFEPEGSGEIMFSKVIDGFLPELFKRWSDSNARHLISIVLFTRIEYRYPGPVNSEDDKEKVEKSSHRDYYRVLTSNMESGRHEAVLDQLKKDFKTFYMDVLVRPGTDFGTVSLSQDGFFSRGTASVETIQGRPAPAVRGNILEAINTASSQFSEDYIDRDLLRTGLSIVIVTPGTGVFEVDPGLLNLTTDVLIENGVGIDLVCLARMPLHSVPLFKYRKSDQQLGGDLKTMVSSDNPKSNPVEALKLARPGENTSSSNVAPGATLHGSPDVWDYAIPHWIDVSFWTTKSISAHSKTRGIRNFPPSKVKPFLTRVKMYEIQMMGIMENDTNGISVPYLPPYEKNYSLKDPRATLGNLQNQSSSSSLKATLTRNNTAGRLSDSMSVSLSPRSPSHINSAGSLSGLVKWMEQHDDKVFNVPKWSAKSTNESPPTLLRSQTANTGVITAVVQARKEHIKEAVVEPAPIRPPLLGTITSKSSTNVVTRKTSNTSLLKPGTSLFGSLKSGRPSGLTFKGFGNVNPKATASVELSSETAHRESLLTHAMKSLPTPARPPTADSVQVMTPKEARSPRASTEDERPSQPLSPASKPIIIQQTGEKNIAHPAHGSVTSTMEGSLTPGRQQRLSASGEMELTRVPNKRITLMPALAPWFTILNPSNPDLASEDSSSRLGRWHHVFPRPLHASNMKWRSLCAPASIPLTTEGFPSAEQLNTEYAITVWTIKEKLSPESERDDASGICLFRELISSRFSNGYQVVIGPYVAETIEDGRLRHLDLFDDSQVLVQNRPLYMSRGIHIHRLTLLENSTVEVKQYTKIRGHGIADAIGKRRQLVYTPEVKTSIGSRYEQRKINISTLREEFDWHRSDMFIANHEQENELDMPEELRYWRARYILIPMQPSTHLKKISPTSSEDNDEEIRLEGIYKLTQLWQRNRYAPSKGSHQRIVSRSAADTNPLDIIFRTKPPSAIVASELHESLLEKTSGEIQQKNLLPESELLNRESVDLKALGQLLQSEKGVKMQDRKWHFRTHYNCFVAIELVTWLVDNFKDIENREAAVEFGEQLMKEGLFQHVEKRHNFRDGNFFFQISIEYRQPRADKAQSWLGRFSVPPTPTVESKSPNIKPQFVNEDDAASDERKSSENHAKSKVVLSKKLIYDVDRKKRSYRREIINLHYDRISSADDCYHIRINWLNVTPKLVEDAVSSWASAVERYGLRLVEVPITEASGINEIHTFRSPYIITLAKQPPEVSSRTIYDIMSTTPRPHLGRFPYHKALLKKFNFVLDLEAAKEFPEKVDVTYSWGKPDYQYPQFISRDGVLLVQIRDDGNLLLLANRLSNNRRGTHASARPYSAGVMMDSSSKLQHNKPIPTSTIGTTTAQRPPSLHMQTPRQSPFASPGLRATPDVALGLEGKSNIITPVTLKDQLEAFCTNAKALEKFFDEVKLDRGNVTGPSTPDLGAIAEGKIALPPVPPLKDIGLGGNGKR